MDSQTSKGFSLLRMRHESLLLMFFCALFCLSVSCDKGPDCIPIGMCRVEPDPGPCNAAITKYYFDQLEKKCKTFTWGGCGGGVPFDTIEECLVCECADN